ncbi:MAG: DUF1836 domain-containing protein [Lachnospiraceae bacterium]|nr:DUF1836 domain-containing protein [Lachnospiraceae bacterium]
MAPQENPEELKSELIARLETVLEEMGRLEIPASADMPRLDLYMDQVTTVLEGALKDAGRKPDQDKVLTKTMINNYAKDGLLIPPVKKKYTPDHMLLLTAIYYLKNILTINDVEQILSPLKEAAFTEEQRGEKVRRRARSESQEPERGKTVSFREVYDCLAERAARQKERTAKDVLGMAEEAGEAFPSGGDGGMMERLAFIIAMSTDIYVRKLILERMLDLENPEQ